ncbi:MAG: ornithine cyclodeaminase family protein [Acidimicrobiia bacterium]|nr:ornithine cyclodeaminase family protein [Acidimicrobiia bacterium]
MDSREYRDWVNERLGIGREILYLSLEDCKATGPTNDEIFDLTERALTAHGNKQVEMPAKIGLHPQPDSLMHAMPAYVGPELACGLKWAANFPTNQDRYPDLVPTSGLLVFNDHESGLPMAIMDAYWITEVRTPSVAFAAAKRLARPDTKAFGMVGCGIQGKAHVRMVERVMHELEEIVVYDVFDEAMDKLIEVCQPDVKASIRKASGYEDVVRTCGVFATATPITHVPEPKLEDSWFRPGQTVLLSDCHSLVEDVTVKRADKYLVDSVDQHQVLEGYGYYPWGLPEIYAETGEVVAGVKDGRSDPDELIVVNNVGMAVEDVVVARQIFDRALDAGIGVRLPLWDRTS